MAADLPEIDLDQFEDYESDDLDMNDSDEGDDYISGMWGSYGFRGAGAFGAQRNAQDIVIAHGMVQSFVNAFARDGSYVVRFSDTTRTAGTDMKTRYVRITPAPILDERLEAREAGLVLTGLAVHEICHPRYGRSTYEAARAAFPYSRVAQILSNLIDDVRIERRFVADYPGYAGVFEPLLRYISKGPVPTLSDQLNLAIAAIRFDRHADWGTDQRVAEERAWWQQWSAKIAREDSPRRHVEGIREALKHMLQVAAEQKAAEPAPQDGPKAAEDGPGDDETDERGDDAADGDEGDTGPQDAVESQSEIDNEIFGDLAPDTGVPKPEPAAEEEEAPDPTEGMSDADIGAAADRADDEASGEDLPTCPGTKEVDETAREAGGVSQSDIDDAEQKADAIVKEAEETEDGVDVATHYRGMLRKQWSDKVRRNGPASRFIRDALMRARSGHTETARYQKRGRLDNHGLSRVAHGDFRVFERHHAPGPEKLLIWVLIDCSGSMTESSADAATAATAIADAAQHVRTTRMAVWGWSYSFRKSEYQPGVCRVWQTGQPTSDIAKIADLRQGGTPDVQIMNWAYRAILREARSGERPVILFASDGGGMYGLQQKVAEAREHGVDVYSVALGDGVDVEYQQEVYGEGNFVEWQGSIIRTARPLAKLVARMVSAVRPR